MGRYDRNPTDIEIEVIDLCDAMAHVLKTYKEQKSNNPESESYEEDYDRVVGFRALAKVGRHITPAGDIYLLDEEGVGPATPITDAEPAWLPVYKVFEGGGMSFVPVTEVGLWPNDIRQAPVIEKVNLAEFIRKFGSRLLRNYEEWREALEAVAKG